MIVKLTTDQLARYTIAEWTRRDCLRLGRDARRDGRLVAAEYCKADAATWAKRRDAVADEQ